MMKYYTRHQFFEELCRLYTVQMSSSFFPNADRNYEKINDILIAISYQIDGTIVISSFTHILFTLTHRMIEIPSILDRWTKKTRPAVILHFTENDKVELCKEADMVSFLLYLTHSLNLKNWKCAYVFCEHTKFNSNWIFWQYPFTTYIHAIVIWILIDGTNTKKMNCQNEKNAWERHTHKELRIISSNWLNKQNLSIQMLIWRATEREHKREMKKRN